jgi:hypothetical protein
VSNINDLQLPAELTKEIQETVHLNRMEYEPWIESADSFAGLKESLKKRGYKNLPIQQAPKHMPLPTKLKEQPKTADTRHLSQRKSMIRKGSDQARRT